MDFLKSLCSVPTAPFAEHRVVDFARSFVKRRRNLSLREDRFGNLLIELKSPALGPRWVFTAHMDHPGFIAQKMLDGKRLQAAFRGWVKVEFVRGSRVRFFDHRGEATGTVIEASAKDYDQRAVPEEVIVRVNRPVAAGSPGMFDQGVGRYSGGKFLCRVCDDLDATHPKKWGTWTCDSPLILLRATVRGEMREEVDPLRVFHSPLLECRTQWECSLRLLQEFVAVV